MWQNCSSIFILLYRVSIRVEKNIYSWWRHQMYTFSALLAFVRGIHRWPVIGACMNAWVNNRGAGDLRRHRTHYAVTVMFKRQLYWMFHWLAACNMPFNQCLPCFSDPIQQWPNRTPVDHVWQNCVILYEIVLVTTTCCSTLSYDIQTVPAVSPSALAERPD